MATKREGYTRAMKRLAGHLGYSLEHHNRAGFVLVTPDGKTHGSPPLPPQRCLGSLIFVATAKSGGDMSYRDVAAIADLGFPPSAINDTTWYTYEIVKMAQADLLDGTNVREPANEVVITEINNGNGTPKETETETKPKPKSVPARERECRECGATFTLPVRRGRPPVKCEECRK